MDVLFAVGDRRCSPKFREIPIRLTVTITITVTALVLCGCSVVDGGDGGVAAADTAATVDSQASKDANDDASVSHDVDAAAAGDVCDCPANKACVAGVCGDKTCTDDAMCNPPGGPLPDATPFFCPDGTCRAWQCANDGHCASPQKCNTVTYACYTPATGCTLDAHCVDADSCTNDACDIDTGDCEHKAIAGCCKVAADCNDSDPCTSEGCDAGKCTWKGKGGCCSKNGECDDGDACTADSCSNTLCKHSAAAGCCKDAGDCDDGDDGTVDSCKPGVGCVHAIAGLPTACSGAADCATTACAKGTCVSGSCSFAATGAAGCCESAATCGLGSACSAAVCSGWSCGTKKVPAGVSGPHASWDFEAGLDGWAVVKANTTAFFHSAKGWSAHGGAALRYGVVGKDTWGAGLPNHGTATSPALVVPSGAHARFLLFFDGEPASGVQLFGLRVVTGGKATDVWSKNADLKGNTAGAWKEVDVDLAAFVGKSVQLQWWFDVTVKYPKEDGHGLVIDAGVVEGVCK